MTIKKLAWLTLALVVLAVFALIQFIPAQLPHEQRAPQSGQQPQSGK